MAAVVAEAVRAAVRAVVRAMASAAASAAWVSSAPNQTLGQKVRIPCSGEKKKYFFRQASQRAGQKGIEPLKKDFIVRKG